ncbi:MAG: hypothetical protein KDB14_35015, partial [Planctomycetales bacterium]|nr:hypothetical protein [Planctomycetales bacterium]
MSLTSVLRTLAARFALQGQPVRLTMVAIFCVTTIGSAHGAEAQKPNVVFFLVDDLGYMDIGANNPETFYETPHVDR